MGSGQGRFRICKYSFNLSHRALCFRVRHLATHQSDDDGICRSQRKEDSVSSFP